MKSNTASGKVFQDYQNKFRGLASSFKSRKFTKDNSSLPSPNFRRGLRELFLCARVEINPIYFDNFIQWVNHQLDTQLAEISSIPTGYEELSGVFTKAPETSLSRELLWITSRIKAGADQINDFRVIAELVEQKVFSGKFEDSLSLLQSIESKYGVSLWSVQLRIAIEHHAGGLERQKRYTSEVRSVYKRGLLSFTAYHTSIRNEDKTTLAKYLDDVKANIERNKHYEKFIKTYVRYRLAEEWPDSKNGLADILRVEQSHSFLDVYETFIAVAQQITRRDDLIEERKILEKCLKSLDKIDDFRLKKAFITLTGCVSGIKYNRNTDLSNALLCGNVLHATNIFRSMIKPTNQVDPWQLIYAGFGFSHAKRTRTKVLRLPQYMPQLIGKVLSCSEESADAFGQLKKQAANLRGLPTAVAITEMLQQLRRAMPDEQLRPWLIGMNSRTFGVEDIIPGSIYFLSDRFHTKNTAPCLTERAWINLLVIGDKSKDEGRGILDLFAAAGFIREGFETKAVEILESNYRKNEPEPVRFLAVTLSIHAKYSIGDKQGLIQIVADEVSRSHAYHQLLPIVSILENYQWDDYKASTMLLSAPIALHILWTCKESESTASLLRFATSTLLRSTRLDRPSKLFDHAGNYPRHQLVYFLREVCVPNIIDVSRVLKGTRAVMEERQAICAALRLLDSDNSDYYLEEVSSISNQQALEDGQWIVDRTRIHVDTEALSRWATKELAEDYARYQDLLSVDVGTIQNLDDVIKDLLAESPFIKNSSIPGSEADSVLFNILKRLSDEFLNSPTFGLDFYLSQRIRHQSFIGLIRGPLEFSNLITTRESECGSYRRNDFWLNKFNCLNADAQYAISEALSDFSENFDESLITAKDVYFHVKSHEKNIGLFYIDISPQLFALARAVTSRDDTIYDFIITGSALLWAALEQSLISARKYISEDIKTKIVEEFDRLRATVSRYAEDSQAFLEFDMEIGNRSTEVQRALDEASTWFTRADIDAYKQIFKLDQIVRIAIDSACKCQRAFEPIISSNVRNGEIEMVASTLVFVHDVLFVALDNARAHSGLKNPKVIISVNPDINNGMLSIEVVSDVKVHNKSAQEKSIQKSRFLIEQEVASRGTRKEGGSGFLKLAAVVRQSSKGSIKFGFTESGQFHLAVVYSLIFPSADCIGELHD